MTKLTFDIIDAWITDALNEITNILKAHDGFIRFTPDEDKPNIGMLPVLISTMNCIDYHEYRCEAIRLTDDGDIECFCENRAFNSKYWTRWTDEEMQSAPAECWPTLDWDGMENNFVSNLYNIVYHLIDNQYE